jgi:peroxiredoxin
MADLEQPATISERRPAPRPGFFRAVVVPVLSLTVVAVGVWLVLGRPLPGQESSSITLVEAPDGGQYAAIDIGPVEGSGGPRVGQPAPDFVLPQLDGGVVRLSDLRGNVVLVNFWASWCTPCKREVPALVSVYERFQEQGFVVLGVDYQEPVDDVRGFVEEWGMSYPVLLDADAAVVRQYRLTGIPESYLIDQDGVLRERRIGEMKQEEIACMAEALLTDPASYREGQCR